MKSIFFVLQSKKLPVHFKLDSLYLIELIDQNINNLKMITLISYLKWLNNGEKLCLRITYTLYKLKQTLTSSYFIDLFFISFKFDIFIFILNAQIDLKEDTQ